MVDYRTEPAYYRHWKLSVAGSIARLRLDVDEQAALGDGYELKLNSYDLGVDIELNDAVQRLRFEHPSVAAVVIESAKDRVFSAGANIGMLKSASHQSKVNFCKFTNETRNAIEDACNYSEQRYLCAINGTAAGGGYELALASDYIILIDDGASAVSLPEVPLLAVLPGTGGLIRLVDKRKVRRDQADFLCTVEEGIRGHRAVEWRLVDELAPSSRFDEIVRERALALADQSSKPKDLEGIHLTRLERKTDESSVHYSHVNAHLDRSSGTVTIILRTPQASAPADLGTVHRQGANFWPLALARELDDLILHLRTNEPELGTWVFKCKGDLERSADFDRLLSDQSNDWLIREITLYWKRVLKRLEVTSRSLIALIEPGSAFAGFLLEVVLGADRSYMLDGEWQASDRPPAAIRVSETNFGALPTVNGITRLRARYLDDPDAIRSVREVMGKDLTATEAERLRLVTFCPDDIDWHDEVRLAVEARASFSPDALTGTEASLRFPGPETMESKIFGRLSAWAKLDISATQRGRRARRPYPLRHWLAEPV